MVVDCTTIYPIHCYDIFIYYMFSKEHVVHSLKEINPEFCFLLYDVCGRDSAQLFAAKDWLWWAVRAGWGALTREGSCVIEANVGCDVC